MAEHGKEILVVLVMVILIRMIKMTIRRRKEKKAILKEQEQAALLERNEALNREILNPERRPGDVEEQKHAYKVEYADRSSGSRSGFSRGSHSGAGSTGRIFASGKRDKTSAEGAWLKITEQTSLSKRSYMFRNNETVRVGDQYGNTSILSGNPGEGVLYFEIIPVNNHYYIRSDCAERVMISRMGSTREVGDKEIALCDGDRVSVCGKIYEISFFRQ